MGLALAWRRRERPGRPRRRRRHGRRRHRLRALPGAVRRGSSALDRGLHRCAGAGRGRRGRGLAPAATGRVDGARRGGRSRRWRSSAGTVWASATVVAAELGPFDSPYQPAALTASRPAANAHVGRQRGRARRAPRPGPPDGERDHLGDLGAVERPHPRHRPRVPPGRRLQRTGTRAPRWPSSSPTCAHGQDRGWCSPPSRRGLATPTCSGRWRTAGPCASPGPRRRARRWASTTAQPRTPAPRTGTPDSHGRPVRRVAVGQASPRRVPAPGGQTSRKRRMAMAEPTEPIAMPTITTTTLVSRTSDPVMCMAVKMLLVVRPLPSWLMKR